MRSSSSEEQQKFDSEGQSSQNNQFFEANQDKKTIRILRLPFYKWTIIYFDKKSQKIRNELVRTRSPAWIIFRKAVNKLEAKCRICRHTIRARFGNTTQLLRHIDLEHYELKRQIQQIFENRKNNFTYQIINLMQLYDHTQQKQSESEQQQLLINYNEKKPKKIRPRVQQYRIQTYKNRNRQKPAQNCLEFEINTSEILKKMKKNPELTIYQQYCGHELVSAVLLTRSMREQVYRFRDLVSFWYYPAPVESLQYRSVLLIITQDQNLNPVVLGLIMVFTELLLTYDSIRSFFKKSLLVNFFPDKVFVIGPSWLIKIFQKYFNESQEIQQLKKNLISGPHLISCLVTLTSTKDKNFIQYIFARNTRILSKQVSNSFAGFILTESFSERILEMIGDNTDLNSLLNCIIETDVKFNQQFLKQVNFPQLNIKLKNIQLKIIPQIPQIKQIAELVSEEIFLKICLVCAYAKSSLYINENIKGKTILPVHVINQGPQWKQEGPFQVIYNKESQKFICPCKLLEISGVVCPHLMYILLLRNQSLRSYVYPRWFINQPNQQIEILGKSDQPAPNITVIDLNKKQDKFSEQQEMILRSEARSLNISVRDFYQNFWA